MRPSIRDCSRSWIAWVRRNPFELLLVSSLIFGSSLCVGCRSPAPPGDHFYRIELPRSESVEGSRTLGGILLVDRFQVEALTGGRPLVYRESRDSVEVGRHPYAVWSEAPTLMIQYVIADQLRTAGVAERVVLPAERTEPDFILRGRLVRLEHVRRERIAILEVDLWLEGGGNRPADTGWSRHFRYEESMTDGTPAAAVEAYRRSLSRLSSELIIELDSRETR